MAHTDVKLAPLLRIQAANCIKATPCVIDELAPFEPIHNVVQVLLLSAPDVGEFLVEVLVRIVDEMPSQSFVAVVLMQVQRDALNAFAVVFSECSEQGAYHVSFLFLNFIQVQLCPCEFFYCSHWLEWILLDFGKSGFKFATRLEPPTQ